jgi:putative Mg2+ transporter-C (MgtC) family protein
MPIESIAIKLLLAVLLGGIIGFDREYMNKAAGLRTLILICLGSCLFTIFSIVITNGTPDRTASNIVTGIGFLGAGVIFKDENRVKGLTTAASIWVTAAIGMGIGGGYYWAAVIGAGCTLLTLNVLTFLEESIDKINQTREYRIVSPYTHDALERYENLFRKYRLRFSRNKQSRINENIIGFWVVKGRDRNHNLFIEEILTDNTVKEFDF